MDFSLSDEQSSILKVAKEISSKFDTKYWQQKDERGEFPKEFVVELVKHGLLGIMVPEEFGGAGLGLLDMSLVCEEIAASGAGMDGTGATFMGGAVFGGITISNHGTEEQKQRYLRRIANGEMFAIGITEAEAGSNTFNIKTEARLDGNIYIVNGHKLFVSHLNEAATLITLARTSNTSETVRKTEGLTLLLSDLPNPRITKSPHEKCGMHIMETSELFINDLRIPKSNVIGEVGKGWECLLKTLNAERVVIAAAAVGTGKLVLKKASEYACNRKVWGKPIGTHQGLQFPLADSFSKLQVAELMVHKAAWLFDMKRSCALEASIAKVVAASAAFEAADRAMQTFGGMGYMRVTDVERHWRNLRLNKIAPVSDELSLSHIATKGLGLPRSF